MLVRERIGMRRSPTTTNVAEAVALALPQLHRVSAAATSSAIRWARAAAAPLHERVGFMSWQLIGAACLLPKSTAHANR